MSETQTEVRVPQAFPGVLTRRSRRAKGSHSVSSPVTVALFPPIPLNKIHMSRFPQDHWAAPFCRLSPVSSCSKGPNSGCVTGDFLCPRRVCAFSISSSKSYTGTTFLHFMLRRCSIPLLLWRRTKTKSVIWVQQCKEGKHVHGFESPFFIRRCCSSPCGHLPPSTVTPMLYSWVFHYLENQD